MSKFRKIVGGFLVSAVVTGGVLISSNSRGQEKPDDLGLTAREKAMMADWQKAMAPGKEHEALAKKVGNWKVEMIDFSMGEKKSEASAEIKMLMGGRYQEIKIKGTMMGQPFEGCSTTAFDNVRKIYLNTWIDSMGTSITTAEGKAVDENTVEMKGQMVDPSTGGMLDFRNITKNTDADHFTYEIYFQVHGKEMKIMASNYSRIK